MFYVAKRIGVELLFWSLSGWTCEIDTCQRFDSYEAVCFTANRLGSDAIVML